MPVTAIVGGHWGDEGKGKVVDALAAGANLVIRYNGGNNAGHTVVSERGTLRLHQVPSGICYAAVDCVIGPGVVVNPAALCGELWYLCEEWSDRLIPYVVDTHPLVQAALRRDDAILLEGQLGVMRDLDWGAYPYVTSSTCLAGGACAGAGIPPQRIGRVIGVVKAYSTAVGAGPVPTELGDGLGARLRELGQEYGASTGRPRRCGWFDGV